MTGLITLGIPSENPYNSMNNVAITINLALFLSQDLGHPSSMIRQDQDRDSQAVRVLVMNHRSSPRYRSI